MLSKLGRRFFSGLSSLKKTPLYDVHIEHGAKMVDYAGFEMPVLYKDQTHVESHNWTRKRAGLFDVSHMLQHKFSGPDATRFLEKVTPSDIKGLGNFTSTLSVLLNKEGGIVDDTIITKHGDNEFYIVTNAGCRDKDLSFLRTESLGFDIEHSTISGGLIALQGPQAVKNLKNFLALDFPSLYFGQSRFADFGGVQVHVSRGGYTGEDGVEISIPDSTAAADLARQLLRREDVKPIGLAARDSLRLEAGMCLYGHELTEETSPVAARLAWTIGKTRRASADFNGASRVLHEIASKDTPIRSGLVSSGPAPRQGANVFDKAGNVVGEVTSGSMSPTLQTNIAMAYLPRNMAKPSTELNINIRGKLRPAVVVKMPFVRPHYLKQS